MMMGAVRTLRRVLDKALEAAPPFMERIRSIKIPNWNDMGQQRPAAAPDMEVKTGGFEIPGKRGVRRKIQNDLMGRTGGRRSDSPRKSAENRTVQMAAEDSMHIGASGDDGGKFARTFQ